MTSCQQIVTSLSIFQFMVNLEKPGNQIPGAQSVKLKFSSTVTSDSSHTVSLRKGTIFVKKADLLQKKKKNADTSKINKTVVIKDTFPETTYVCVLTN